MTVSATPRQDDDGPRIENVVYVEYVAPYATVVAPFAIAPETRRKPTQAQLPGQRTAWIATNHSRKPHGKPPYADITYRAS